MKGIRNRKNGKGCKKWKEEGRMGKDVRNERKKEKEEWERM